MKDKYNSIKIYIKEDYEAMSVKAASIVEAQVTLKPDSVLGLATGSTPDGMYKQLVKMYKNDLIDFSEVTSFNLDEYYDLEPSNEQSYIYYMNHHLFKHVNMNMHLAHVPNGIRQDVKKVCQEYDEMIQKAGDIDLQILGIGRNGHIGFNEPDVHFEAGTHLVDLDEDTIKDNARFFDSIDQVPKQAISMGIRNIMHAKKIVLMASGKEKSNIMMEMLFGPVTPNVPASVLQLHNDVTIIMDEEAGSEVKAELGRLSQDR